jgi:hypothetical protein
MMQRVRNMNNKLTKRVKEYFTISIQAFDPDLLYGIKFLREPPIELSEPGFSLVFLKWSKKDPISLRKIIHQYALYFKRTFDYDFIQYDVRNDSDNSDKDEAFLIFCPESEGPPLAIGAGCFRWRECHARKHEFALQWVYIHPMYRERGVFKTAWPEFLKRYGDFTIEPPFQRGCKHLWNRG